MSIQLITITAPDTPPVSTTEAKAHLRVTHSTDDTYIAALVDSARLTVEARAGIKLYTQTVELRADSFIEPRLADFMSRDIISLRVAPVQSVDSVKHYSSDDVDTTISSSDYWTDLVSVPCRVQIKDSWPSTNERIGNVRIRLTAGWPTADEIPEIFKTAIKLLIGHYYENREEVTDIKLNEIPEGIQNVILNNPEFHHYSTGSM